MRFFRKYKHAAKGRAESPHLFLNCGIKSAAVLKIKRRITPSVSNECLPEALMTFQMIAPAYLAINHIHLCSQGTGIGREGVIRTPRAPINNILYAGSFHLREHTQACTHAHPCTRTLGSGEPAAARPRAGLPGLRGRG